MFALSMIQWRFQLIKLFVFALCYGICINMSSCANIIPPGGGPRDSLPPKLITALPKDSAVNVNPKLITLNFNEYLTLQNVNENLIVSPTIKNNPLVDSKLRTITIKIKDTLDPNTTYSLHFGESIKDVNEGNILRNFKYVFSTGKTIDDFSYKGRVYLAEKGKVDTTLLVILHNNLNDSAIVKERPRYYTRINGKGEFSFTNLSAGIFRVYVLPNDYSKKYDDSTKLFAFRSDDLVISNNTPYDTLYAYEAFKTVEKITKPTETAGKNSKEDKRLKYAADFEGGQQDLLSNLNLNFNKKLQSVDSSKIAFCDSNYKALKGYRIELDTSKTKLSFIYPWKELSSFRIVIQKDAIADTSGITLPKTDTIRFITKKEADYGSIKLRFTNLNLSKHPVLQVVESDNIVESIPLTSYELIRKLYKPGNYDLRILYDTNQNGIWDPGSFGKIKKQPEIVKLISKVFSVRSNWDNEVTIGL
jgi:hypothetical protein